jgi:Zn-finger protein
MKNKNEHYKFFQNKECEYFPCHPTEDIENFNCLFCYCPLYTLGKNCGGNYTYMENGIKNCKNCDIPHKRENYDQILKKLMIVIEKVKADTK